MRKKVETEAFRKVIWAKRFKFYGAVPFSFAMLILIFGNVSTQSGETLFVLFAFPGVALLTSLFFIRCSDCGASLYFRKGYFILTWGLKWIPVWILPLPERCEICGLIREFNGKI